MRKRYFSFHSYSRLCMLAVLLFGVSMLTSAQARVKAMSMETQTNSVTTNLGIYGGDTWDIAVDGDHVYTIASGVPNGFFSSADAAVTWQRPAGSSDFGGGSAVEVDAASHAVYTTLGGDLYKSTDFGATLTKIASNAGFALLFAQSKLLYAYNDTVYVSTDNGTTFTSAVVASGANISDLAASATLGTFYAVSYSSAGVGTLYRSTDSGATWTAVTVSAGGTMVTNFSDVDTNPFDANALTVGTNGHIWLSLDAGSTWTEAGTSPLRSCGPSSTWTSTRWYSCAGYSTDNGTTWTDMDMHTNVMRGPGKIITFDTANENTMYGDCMSGVCKSTDGGLTWNNSLNGITGVNVLAISQTTDKGTVWISSSNGLGKSTNFTSATPTWTWPILPCDHSSRCDSSGIGESVWVKPDNADIVLAGSIGGYLYRSADGGTTWTAQIPSVVNVAKFKTDSWNNLRPQYFVNDPADTSIVYAALVDPVDHKGAVLKSTDAGTTWTDLAITDDAPATRLAMSTTGILYAGTGEGKTVTDTKGLYRYESGAWTKLSGVDSRLNISSIMVDPEVQTTLYVTAQNDIAPDQADGFYRSTDAGATWTKIIPTSYQKFGALTVQKSTVPNTLYMSATDSSNHGVLLKSSDQGTTWGTLYTGLKSESFTTVLFDGLVAGNKHGVFAMKSMGKFATTQSAKKVKSNMPVVISTILKDSTTKKLLASKTVDLYRKDGITWKKYKSGLTNKKGVVKFTVRSTKNRDYRMTWTPNKKDKPEYAATTSGSVTITIKKK